jgi:hypothetical protein
LFTSVRARIRDQVLARLNPVLIEVVYRVAEIELRPTSNWAKARRSQIDQKEVTA